MSRMRIFAPPAGRSGPRNQIRGIVHVIEFRDENYEAALNAGDIDAILGLYGSEPVFMPQNAPALVGRDAVRAGYEQVFGAVGFNVTLTVHDAEEAGDWAWVRSSTGTMKILESGADIPEGNNELFVLRREGGDWKLHRYLFATALPA